MELGEVSIVSELKFHISLEFFMYLSGTKEVQGIGTKGGETCSHDPSVFPSPLKPWNS